MVLRFIAHCVLILSFTTSSAARDYGNFGALFPVIEPSMLDTIHARLQEMEGNGELDAMKQRMQDTTRAYAQRPYPVAGISHAQEYRQFEVDLSVTLDRDLSDHNGVVFAKAGTRVNPLDYSRFNRRLVFIDGDDPRQVNFALLRAAQENVKVILVNGAPLVLTETHQRRFWFDQGGVLVARFGIAHVPAVVTRSYPNMIVEEIPLHPQREAN